MVIQELGYDIHINAEQAPIGTRCSAQQKDQSVRSILVPGTVVPHLGSSQYCHALERCHSTLPRSRQILASNTSEVAAPQTPPQLIVLEDKDAFPLLTPAQEHVLLEVRSTTARGSD
jgi:hypothetical protein